ncbi:MAG: RND transporter [Desulfobulbaceae bacterium A2]|nr:MAG: RND transporter [Desulfobulbaceae bacterium A2]
MQWLDQAPLLPLVMVALLLGLAPFFSEPHLVEKLRLLTQGGLRRPLDIFDLCFHGLPVALLLVKLARMVLAGHGRA